MKKLAAGMMMFMMLCLVPMTVDAAKSPSGQPVTEEGTDKVTSPKTGESEILLYGCGMAAVVLASGAVVLRKRAM